MPQKTDYHEINIPVPFDISSEDTNVWGEILNEALSHLEENTILRGDDVTRPFADREGRLFLNTDDRRIQYDTGDRWEYLGVQADFRDNDTGVMKTPKEIDFNSDISLTKTGENRLQVDVDDSFVRREGDGMEGDLTLGEDLLATDGEVIWDESEGFIPEDRLENNSVTINSGNALDGGATLTLDDATTLDVVESEISHGNVSDLTETDHHTQYMHVDARRGFDNPVDGVSPNSQTHLATKEYVDSTAQGLDYKDAVIAEQNSPPDSPGEGDRYLVDDSPAGDWSDNANEIAEYDGSAWTLTAPDEGWSVFVEGLDKLMTYNGSDWVTFGSTIAHHALQGLADDDHTQYLHRDGRRAMNGVLDAGGNNIEDDGTVVWDSANGWIPLSSIRHDSVTVTTGNQITGGGEIQLGDSITIDVDDGPDSGLDADTIDGYQADDLRNPKNIAQLTTTDTSTNINATSWTTVPWNTELVVDGAYSHDTGTSPGTITFEQEGTYRVLVSLAYDANGNSHVNPGIKLNIDGTRVDTFGLTGYTSSDGGHEQASNLVMRTITVSEGETLEVQTTEMGSSGTVTMRSEESLLEIEQVNVTTPLAGDADTLDGLESTQFLRGDTSATFTGDVFTFDSGSDTDVVRFLDSSGGTLSEHTLRYDSIPLQLLAGDSGTTALSLLQNGNVGVQNDSPNHALDVSGIINVTNDILVGGDVTTGSTTIWDSANAYVPQSSVEQGDGSGLDADTLDGNHVEDIGVGVSEDGTKLVETITDINFTGALSASADGDGTATVTYTSPGSSVPLSVPVTRWADGLSSEEIYRTNLKSGEALEVNRLEIQPKGGGDVTGLTVDIYDETNDVVIASTNDSQVGNPIGTSGEAATVLVRVSNSSGTFQNASITAQLQVV